MGNFSVLNLALSGVKGLKKSKETRKENLYRDKRSFNLPRQVARPIRAILDRWIYEGELEDLFNEVSTLFMVVFFFSFTLCTAAMPLQIII